jgi:hypothetical protein
MTKKEAFLFFSHTEEDDLYDLYEERLFEYKTFYLTKFPIEKVFLAKEKKMLQMHEAFTIIIEKELPFKKPFFDTIDLTSETILETFNSFQKNKNQLKNQISKSQSALELSKITRKLLETQKTFCDKWKIDGSFEEEKIIYSIEPDPMTTLNSIIEFNSKGGFTFEDLNSKRNILPEMLFNEAKRLSLCRKIV